MRISTEFISWIYASTISISFDFHNLVKGKFSDFCLNIYVDHYVLHCHNPLKIVPPRHQCVIIHEVDVSKDRLLTS